MASKLEAARIASWSGVPTVIANAARPGVLAAAAAGEAVGTRFEARRRSLTARKLWIAFAAHSAGAIIVDDGARRALVERKKSLLPAGVVSVEGRFVDGDTVEVRGTDGSPFARGHGLRRRRPAAQGQGDADPRPSRRRRPRGDPSRRPRRAPGVICRHRPRRLAAVAGSPEPPPGDARVRLPDRRRLRAAAGVTVVSRDWFAGEPLDVPRYLLDLLRQRLPDPARRG